MLQAADYKHVRLEPSRVLDGIQETIRFYQNIPEDNFFKYIREDAGLPAPGEYYSGWFVNSRGVMLVGQWISAFSRMYAFTGEESLRNKAITFFEEFQKCFEILKNTPRKLLNSYSFYSYEKILRAIIDLEEYAGYKRAVEWIPELLAFAEESLSTDNAFGDNSTEWYTMPESLLAVYEHYGIKKAMNLAHRWEYRSYWDVFYQDRDPFSRTPEAGLYSEFVHAYSHVNSFNSCAAFYKVTKDPYYLAVLRKFFDFMQHEEVMATGGYGPNFEHIMPKYRIIDALRTGHDSFETQCDTYAAFRLGKYLTEFTEECRFGNWTERLIWNAALATIPMTRDGRVIYYSDYNMYGAEKVNRADAWTCCTGTRPLLMLELPRLIYFIPKESAAEEDLDDTHPVQDLFVNQFVPSSVSFPSLCLCENQFGFDKTEQGENQSQMQIVTLSLMTQFPEEDAIGFSIHCAHPFFFGLHIRMPDWMEKTLSAEVRCTDDAGIVSCSKAEGIVDDGGWFTIRRVWRNGDELQLNLPQQLRVSCLDPVKGGPIAFAHGPVVLAADYSGPQTPCDHMNVKGLLSQLYEEGNHPLHYSVQGRSDISFKPFYEFREHERYFLYHDTGAHARRNFF